MGLSPLSQCKLGGLMYVLLPLVKLGRRDELSTVRVCATGVPQQTPRFARETQSERDSFDLGTLQHTVDNLPQGSVCADLGNQETIANQCFPFNIA